MILFTLNLLFVVYSILIGVLIKLQVRTAKKFFFLSFSPYFNGIYYLTQSVGILIIINNHEYYSYQSKYNSIEQPIFEMLIIFVFHILINIGILAAIHSSSFKVKNTNLHVQKWKLYLLIIICILASLFYLTTHELELLKRLSIDTGNKLNIGGSYMYATFLLPYTLIILNMDTSKKVSGKNIILALTFISYILELRIALIVNLVILMFLIKIYKTKFELFYTKVNFFLKKIIWLSLVAIASILTFRWIKYFLLKDNSYTHNAFMDSIIERISVTPTMITISSLQSDIKNNFSFGELYIDQFLSILRIQNINQNVGELLFESTMKYAHLNSLGFAPPSLLADFYISFGLIGVFVAPLIFGFLSYKIPHTLLMKKNVFLASLAFIYILILIKASTSGIYSIIPLLFVFYIFALLISLRLKL